MALSFSDKQKWTATFVAIVNHSEKEEEKEAVSV